MMFQPCCGCVYWLQANSAAQTVLPVPGALCNNKLGIISSLLSLKFLVNVFR